MEQNSVWNDRNLIIKKIKSVFKEKPKRKAGVCEFNNDHKLKKNEGKLLMICDLQRKPLREYLLCEEDTSTLERMILFSNHTLKFHSSIPSDLEE